MEKDGEGNAAIVSGRKYALLPFECSLEVAEKGWVKGILGLRNEKDRYESNFNIYPPGDLQKRGYPDEKRQHYPD